jgi:hypothetical protein
MKQRMLAIAVSVVMTAAPAFAAQKPKGGQPKSHTVTKSAVKTQPVTHGKSSVKLQTRSGAKPVKVKTSVKTHSKTTSPSTKSTAKADVKASKKTTTAIAPAPRTTTTLTPVQEKLQRNTNLAAKLRSRLPAGTDLMTAAAGFRNLGQFVSTVNASYNHELSFDGLKQRIVYDGMSLGQAMKDMR